MSNPSHKLSSVPFDSHKYHVLLWGLKKIDQGLLSRMKKTTDLSIEIGDGIHLSIMPPPREMNWDSLPNPLCTSTFLRFFGPNISFPAFQLVLDNPKFIQSMSSDMRQFEHFGQDTAQFLAQQRLIHYCIMLRILGFDFIAPMISRIPYTGFQASSQLNYANMVDFEDAPVNGASIDNSSLGFSHITWIKENSDWLWSTLTTPDYLHFKAAFDYLQFRVFTVESRPRIASSWTGIESLMKPPETPLGKNLIFRISSILGSNSERKVRDLWYGGRCRAVHGLPMKEKSLRKRDKQSHRLLCQLIQKLVEDRIIPSRENMDELYPIIG